MVSNIPPRNRLLNKQRCGFETIWFGRSRVDTKWRFQFFAKYDYRFLLDVIIAIIATFFAKAIIAISRLSLSISLE
jgi:hypothetical protein